MAEHTPTRFDIMYRNGAYYVSIPNYHGGEVVDASVFDALVKRLTSIHHDLLVYAGGLPQGSDLRAVLELSADEVARTLAVVGQVGSSGK